jgi:carbonic anhydrase
MKAHTSDTQAQFTPESALEALKLGNHRFAHNQGVERNLMDQVTQTSGGQFPFATVLHCIDSRVSAELLFDQGIGDIFSIRIAGNFANDDILGSMEFACKLAGTKLLVVLGHTHCGAIKGACDHVEMGNLTTLIKKIAPVVEEVEKNYETKGSANAELVQEVADKNVLATMTNIRINSPILAEMESKGEIAIVGGMYNIHNGQVSFF